MFKKSISLLTISLLFLASLIYMAPVTRAAAETISCNAGGSRAITQGTYTDSDGSQFTSGADLTLDVGTGSSCTFTISLTEAQSAINLSSLTVQTGVTVTHTLASTTADTYNWLGLNVTGDVDIQSGGSLNVTGMGYRGGFQPGNLEETGYTAGNVMTDGSRGYTGGSHGGRGSNQYQKAFIPADGYDSISNPTLPGGGGGGYSGSGDNYAGSNGGGVIRITASNIIVNGSINANAAAAPHSGSGGAGGTIYLNANGTISGAGSITANGGTGNRGSGGGGRIALLYGNLTHSGSLTAYGGNTSYDGSAGTIYKKATSQALGDLIINNGGRTQMSYNTSLPTTVPVSDISVTNNDGYAFNSVTVGNYGILDIPTAIDSDNTGGANVGRKFFSNICPVDNNTASDGEIVHDTPSYADGVTTNYVCIAATDPNTLPEISTALAIDDQGAGAGAQSNTGDGLYYFTFSVDDGENDNVDIQVECGDGVYADIDISSTSQGTLNNAAGTYQITDIDTSSGSVDIELVIDTQSTLDDTDTSTFQCRVTPFDGNDTGTPSTITGLSLDNLDPDPNNDGTIEVVNDANSDGVAAVGDTIRLTAGTENTGDSVTSYLILTTITGQAQLLAGIESDPIIAGSLETSGINVNYEMIDDMGNKANVQTSNTINIDQVLPVFANNGTLSISTDNNSDGIAGIGDGLTLTGVILDADDNDVITIDYDTVGGLLQVLMGAEDYVAAGAVDGATTFNITATDDAGNSATTTSDAVTVYNVAHTVEFDTDSSTVSEADGTTDVTIVLDAVSGVDVTVDYAVTGTATHTEDFTLADGTATITAGNPSVDINIPLINDTDIEDDETIILTLSNPGEATLAANTVHTVTLTSEDNTTPTVSTALAIDDQGFGSGAQANDGSGHYYFTFSVDDAENDTLSVQVECGDNAYADIDIISVSSGTLNNAAATYQITDLDTSAGAVDVEMVIDTQSTLDNTRTSTFQCRVTPYDGSSAGTASTVTTLLLDNEHPVIDDAGTISLEVDNNGNNIVNVGDQVAYSAGTVSNTEDINNWSIDGTGFVELPDYILAEGGNRTVIAGSIDDPTHTFTVTVVDDFGNSSSTASNALNVDNQPPTVTSNGILSISTDNNSDGIAKVGDGLTLTGVTVADDDNDVVTIDYDTVGGLLEVLMGAEDFVTAGNVDGDTTFNITVTDDAGNSVTTTSDAVSVDNQVPVIAENGSISISNDVNSDGTAAIGDALTFNSGTESTGDTVTWTINFVDITGQNSLAAGVESDAITAGTYDNANYTFTITVTDDAGNSATTFSDGVNMDNRPPTITDNGTLTITRDNNSDGIAGIGDGLTLTGVTLADEDDDVITIDYDTVGGLLEVLMGAEDYVAAGAIENDPIDFNITVRDDAGNSATTTSDTVNVYNVLHEIQFLTTSATVSETDGSTSVEVVLDSASLLDITVDYTTSGTATNGDDYDLDNGTLTIPSGDDSITLNIPLIDDADGESDENLIVTLSNPGEAELGDNTSFNLTIESDEAENSTNTRSTTSSGSVSRVILNSNNDGPEENASSNDAQKYPQLENHWAEEELTQLIEDEILDRNVDPNEFLEREEAVRIVLESQGIDFEGSAIEAALELGIIEQDRPEDPATRAEILKIIFNTVELKYFGSNPKSHFKDVILGDWFFVLVNFAFEKSIVVGYPDGTFQPHQIITAAEVAKLLHKTLDVMEQMF